MNILHYSLGFPPYRSGGLTKFNVDLMKEQAGAGHNVSLIWPGEISIFNDKTGIRHHRAVDGIGSYEVVNPLPVSYDEGIKEIPEFMKPGDKAVYREFLDKIQPDIIHIHSLMGLHNSLLEAAKEKGIRLVFSAHDYFPICPKVTLYKNGGVCGTSHSCEDCGSCNETALSIGKIKLLQSPIYRGLKDTGVVKLLRARHRDSFLMDRGDGVCGPSEKAPDYKRLRDHFYSMLRMMDMIHYNSTLTKGIYEEHFELRDNKVISITHSDITDQRRVKSFSKYMIRMRYLGPLSAAKGFFVLKNALDRLWTERRDFCLYVHFTPSEVPGYMKCCPRYSYNELENVFNETDVLICPSVCAETFGFTVLEALSFGVPVIISKNTGSKDILAEGTGIVFNDEEELFLSLRSLTSAKLGEMNRAITEKQEILSMKDLSETLINSIYRQE